MPYHSSPTLHTSWKARRRRSHCANTSPAKAKDRRDESSGRTTFGVTLRRCHRLGETPKGVGRFAQVQTVGPGVALGAARREAGGGRGGLPRAGQNSGGA